MASLLRLQRQVEEDKVNEAYQQVPVRVGTSCLS